MRTPTSIYASELQAQHTIQSEDLLKICRLAKIENIFDKIESFSFEQFFGFTCHLFITTESERTREQLAALLPKFGSIAVFSLIKIAHHLDDSESSLARERQVVRLAMESLKAMPLPTLLIGIAQMIDEERVPSQQKDTAAMVAPVLITLTAHHGENTLSLLSQRLSTQAWKELQQQLLQALSHLRAQRPAYSNSQHHVKLRVKASEQQLAEVAC
ncbi:MAG: hypothetical protein AAGB19_01455 [Cyanobacteria bacterium P01_F01_bin.3]